MRKTLTKLFLLTVAILSSACANKDIASPYQIELLHNGQPPQLQNAKVKVKLYGTNIIATGNKATLLSETITDVNAIPSIITLAWPENTHQLIAEPAGIQPTDAGYYLNVSIDVNNDGLFCLGDLRQDFNQTAFQMMANKPQTALQFQLTAVTNEVCEPF